MEGNHLTDEAVEAPTLPRPVSAPDASRQQAFTSAYAMATAIAGQQAALLSHGPPEGTGTNASITLHQERGWPCYRLVPAGAPPQARALYFHGGAFVFQITEPHWSTVANHSHATQSTMVVPIYPLAPLETAVTILETATALAADLLAQDDRPLTIIGESSGGGLALAVCQALAEQGGRPTAAALLLIEPWLDLTLTNADVIAAARADPDLDVPGLAVAARLYAGELPTSDPRVSPLLGELTNLPPITVITSTTHALWADADALRRRAHHVGVHVDLRPAGPANAC